MAKTRMYTWHDVTTPKPGVFQAHMCSTRSTDNSGTDSPEFQANAIIDDLASRPVEDRAILMLVVPYEMHAFAFYDKMVDVLTDNLDEYATRVIGDNSSMAPDYVQPAFGGLVTGTSIMSEREFMDRFFQVFYDQKVELGRIIHDEETGFNYWQFINVGISEANAAVKIQAALDDAGVQAILPSYMAGVTGEGTRTVAAQRIKFNQFCEEVKAKLMLKSEAASYSRLFGRLPKISNFGDLSSPYVHPDPNGWPLPQAPMSDNVSPELYIGVHVAQDPVPSTIEDDFYWNQFCRHINKLRGCVEGVDTNGGLVENDVTPWVPFYSWYADTNADAPASVVWLQEQLIRHGIAMGVTKWVFWNPHDDGAHHASDSDEIRLAARMNKAAPGRKNFPQITVPSTEVITRDVVTRYATFRRIRESQ